MSLVALDQNCAICLDYHGPLFTSRMILHRTFHKCRDATGHVLHFFFQVFQYLLSHFQIVVGVFIFTVTRVRDAYVALLVR